MSGAGTYIVGKPGTYQTLQAALDALAIDQGSTPFTATQTILVYPLQGTNGTTYSYRGCRVPSTLVPTNTYRLVIQSAVPQSQSGCPKLYGKSGISDYEWAGIYVDQVDYVDILDFKIEEFKSGIIFYRSMYGRVISCNLYKNNLFGIQFFESNRGAVVNTSIQESVCTLSVLRSNECVVVHNLFSTGIGSARWCIVAQWEDGTIGSGTPLDQATPIYYAYNNIFHCNGGGAVPLRMPLDIQKTLDSMDGNTYFSLVGSIADIYYTVEGKETSTYINTITEWRRITNAEANSIWDPAGYFGTVNEKKPPAGLVLEDSSGIFNRGIALDVVKGSLPSWFDDRVLDEDGDGNPRDDTATPTPGPSEVSTGDDYDIFADFLGATSDITSDDETKIYGVDRAVSQLQQNLDCWNPEVAAGFFYVGDVAYYLYASKFATTLHDVTWSKVDLPYNMKVRSVGILDTSECDDATAVQWMQRGKTLWANHRGASLSKPITESVRVYGVEQTWDSSDQSFVQTPLTREFSIKDSPKEFFLQPAPAGGGPIVITDETVNVHSTKPDRNDRSLLPLESRYEWDDSLQKGRLKLQGATNRFENPHFHDGLSAWGFQAEAISNYSSYGDHQVIGRQRVHVMCGTSEHSMFRQTVSRFEEDKDLVLSWHMRSDSQFAVRPVVTTYYDDGRIFSTQILDAVGGAFETSAPYSWDRHVIFCKAHEDSVFQEYGNTYESMQSADLRTVNGGTTPKVKFELRGASLGSSEFDAFMAFEGDYLARYAGLPYGDEVTVEYDSSDAGVYYVSDLTISPILNPQHTGFLTIGPIPIEDLDTSVTETGHTSLSDTYKPTRLLGLPWSKLDGPNKYRHVSSDVFALQGQGLPREVGLQPDLPTVKKIECFPSPITLRQGLKCTFHAKVTDSTNNPWAWKDISASIAEVDDHYCGAIGIKEMGTLSRLGVEVETKTDPSGSLVASFISADDSYFVSYFGTSDLYPSSKVSTRYRPSSTNHANATLRRATTLEKISIYGDETSEYVTPVVSGRKLVGTLTELPVFSSVTLQVNGTSDFDVDLFESLNQDFSDNEFYVDYATGKISYRNIRTGTAKVTYIPLYVWFDSSDPNSMQFHANLVSLLTSDMILSYDVMSNVELVADDESLLVPVVLQNPDYLTE